MIYDIQYTLYNILILFVTPLLVLTLAYWEK